ncbi:MAG: UDP-N-acetylmuramate--L-alanine ligase [Candidatus Rokubacteria bacterium]|nr:UDP-N-acetylmuramate--L-alanine ligase [Candidatus Rokubacteria bacterium]
MLKRYQQVHFVGIGGVGMSGIAEVLLTLGYRVTGSDARRSEAVERLERLGAKVFAGHAASHIEGAQVVVYSSAVARDNPELQAARQRGIPVIPRAEMLAELMRVKSGIAIAGTHGKTTTTSMVGAVLAEAGFDPTIVVGGRITALGANARLGQGEFLVAEADESDGSFLKLTPTIAVVTTIDAEHLDYYTDLAAIRETFLQFINKVPFYGVAVLCVDQPEIQALLPRVEKRVITYGLAGPADLVAAAVRLEGLTARFEVLQRGESLGELALQVPGAHNVANALAATAVGLDLEIPFAVVQRALAGFTGVHRRFQVKGEVDGILVVDDYGHHPAEIRATLAAARAGFHRRLVVAFQPHRYTRTLHLHAEFLTAFGDADVLVITDIYPAGETPIPGVHARTLVEGIVARSTREVRYVSDRGELVELLLRLVRPGDLVLTLGAGDIGTVADQVLGRLAAGPSVGPPAPGEDGSAEGERHAG